MHKGTLTPKYVVALVVLAILAVIDYILVEGEIRSTDPLSEMINMSGRQRMLSQRAAFLASQIVAGPSSVERQQASQELGDVLTRMEQAHGMLVSSEQGRDAATQKSEGLSAIYFHPPYSLDQQVQGYLAVGRALLAASPAERTRSNPSFQTMVQTSTTLLSGLDAAVFQYEHEAHEKLASIRKLDSLTLVAVISCLFGIGLFIFRPMTRRIEEQIDGLQGVNADLEDKKQHLEIQVQAHQQTETELRLEREEFDQQVDKNQSQWTETNKALRLSEARFGSLSDASPIGIFLSDTSGDCNYTNPRWQQIVGMSFNDALGNGWASMIYAEDKDDVFAEWEASVGAGREFSCEFRIKRPNGEIRWVHSRAATVESDQGVTVGFVGTTEDITERRKTEEALRESEERFALAIRGTEDGIWDWNIVTDEDYFSPRFKELIGYADDELDAHFDTFESRLHPEDRPPTIEAVKRHLEQRESFLVEYRLKTKEGEYRWFSAGGQAVWDAQGNPLRMAGSIRDITEQRQLEEDLRRHTHEAELARTQVEQQAQELLQHTEALTHSNQELEQFAYISSHDLQEPLRKIQAFGDRLKTKYGETLGEQGQDYLERMCSSAGRMQTLIQDLLKYSRVTSNAQPFVPVNLTQTAKEVVADLENRIEREQGRVDFTELSTIDADPTQMRQLLQNLISNALKFHPAERNPVVTVRGQKTNGTKPEHYQLEVTDNGIGFDEKYLEKIFTPFQRLHGRTKFEGTGIGLAVCEKIARRHGGEITAQSTPGQGTTFVVTLPVAHAEEKEAA